MTPWPIALALAVGAAFGYVLRRDVVIRAAEATGRAHLTVASTLRIYTERLRQPDCDHAEVVRFAERIDGLAAAIELSGKNLGGKP